MDPSVSGMGRRLGGAPPRRQPGRAAPHRRPALAAVYALPFPPRRGTLAAFPLGSTLYQGGVRILQFAAAVLVGGSLALAVLNYRDATDTRPYQLATDATRYRNGAVASVAPAITTNETIVYRQAPTKFPGRLQAAVTETVETVRSHFPRLVQTIRFSNPNPTASTFALASAAGEAVPAPQPITKVHGFAAFPGKDSADPARQVDDSPAADRPLPPAAVRLDEVDDYLWEVYQRLPVKHDSTGDFSWKDPAAARRMGISLRDYVIVGMDPDFREQIYHAGKAMDAAGLHWSMLSAFRDDYRQQLASGFKARGGNSLHGGTARTGGYGHGRAIDISVADGDDEAVWHWIDAHGGKYGLYRPMPGNDPAHLQSKGDWRKLAQSLRGSRGVHLTIAAADTRQETRLADATGSTAKESDHRRTKLTRFVRYHRRGG